MHEYLKMIDLHHSVLYKRFVHILFKVICHSLYNSLELFIQLQDNEGKENGVETDERKDDSIVYADLDKSAMSGGGG